MKKITNRPLKFRVWGSTPKDCDLYNLLKIDKAEHESWEQFTGLKDKKGKKIFEGDFVEFDYCCGESDFSSSRKMIGLVRWSNSGCGFILTCGEYKNSNGRFPMSYCTFGKVVGNIQESPGMLIVAAEYYQEYIDSLEA